MVRLLAFLGVLASAQNDETGGLLQMQAPHLLQMHSPQKVLEEMDCSKQPGGCKPGGGGPPPSNISVCQGDNVVVDPEDPLACLKPICKDGTILNFHQSSVIHNNLGGMGPDSGEKKIHWQNVGEVRGRTVDVIVTTPEDHYYNDNAHLKSFVDDDEFYWPSGPEFVHDHNGATYGAGTIASMAPEGNWTFEFKFVYTDTQTPATIPVLPLTFYDIDGGKEVTSTCDAHTAILHRSSELVGGCSGECCRHQGIVDEIAEPDTWDSDLTEEQLRASVTYVFKGKSEFEMTYATSFSHRIFFFKGSKVLACEWHHDG